MEPIVEVRDKLLQRHGQLDGYKLSFSEVFNGVGMWSLTVGAENQLLPVLRMKGSGIIFTYGNVKISGRMSKAYKLQSANADETPLGLWRIEGQFDNEYLRAHSILPNPALEPDAQDESHYQESGPFETVAKNLVNLNAGASALPRRQDLVVAPDLGRGNTVGVSARFTNLLEELQLRAVTGGMGFHVVQHDDELVFDVYQPRDLRNQVRMTVENGELSSTQWGYSAPSATEVWVLGQGDGENRTVEVVTTPEADAEAVDWGLRYEIVKDQRNTDEQAELQQAGLEILEESGTTVQSVTAVPAEAPNMVAAVDWWLGDLVTVTVDGQDIAAVVTQVSVIVDDRGVNVQAKIGDPVGFSFEYKQAARIKSVESRISLLERNAEGGGGGGASQTKDYIPVWARKIGNTAQSIPSGTQVVVQLRDGSASNGTIDTSVNDRIIATLPGRYLVNFAVQWQTGGTTNWEVRLRKNGVNQRIYASVNDTAGALNQSSSMILDLAAGDYVDLVVAQNSGGANKIISANADNTAYLELIKLEPEVAINGIPTPLTDATRAIFDTVAQMNATPALEGVSAYNRETGLEYIREGVTWRPRKIFAQKYRSSSQSIAGYTNVEPILDQDVNSGMNVAPANRIQVVTPGYYRIYGRTVYGAITSGTAYAHTYLIKLDSSGSSLGTLIVGEAMISTAYSAPAEATIIHYFNAGEMVKLETRHSVSSARPISPNGVASASILSMERLD